MAAHFKIWIGSCMILACMVGCELINEEVFQTSAPVMTAASPTPGPQLRVNITEKAFDPKRLVITPNVTVTWTNLTGTVQGASSTLGPEFFDSREIAPNQTFGYRFTKIGLYQYRSPYSPKLSGTIEVIAAGTRPSPTPRATQIPNQFPAFPGLIPRSTPFPSSNTTEESGTSDVSEPTPTPSASRDNSESPVPIFLPSAG